jgi:tetratricopeptide (TPR) repeat protein/transcriptional regulator with XRE-family HTH domain
MPTNLVALRAKYSFSQSQLADLVGVTTLTLGRWERGEALPRKRNIQALCQVLECTEEDLAFSPQTQAIVAPSSDIAPLYDAIIDGIIPLTPIELIGRETDLARIKEQLLCHTDGSMVLSALNGIPGVGKTSLAIAIAHDADIRASFSDGILWAALGPTPNIPGLLSRWAGLLGLSDALFSKLDEGQKRQTLRSALGTRSMLLVLDDVWKLDDALALCFGGPNCAILLTTRFPVIASQMAVKDALLVEELNPEYSFHLLRTLAPEVAEYAPEKVRALVQAVGGLPLALTLLGNYLRKQSYNVPPRRTVLALEYLNDARVRLQISELHVQAEAHPSIASSLPISLQSIIAVSDRMLTPRARATLYALSVFPPKPETFSEAAALMVAGSTTHELDELVDAGLLESNGSRYRLHRTIADYARFQIDDQAEVHLTRRLIAYMQQYVESYAREYELLEQEMTLLLYVLDRTVTGAAFRSQVVPLVCASAPFLLMRGYYRETERFLDRAYEVALASQDATDIARVLLYLGELDEKRGNVSRAQERYSRAMQEVGDHAPLRGMLLYHMGRLTWKLGDYQEAEALLQEGLAVARKTEQLEILCGMYKTLAALLSQRADWEKAETYAREGLAIARLLQDRQEIIGLQLNPGCCLYTPARLLQDRQEILSLLCCLYTSEKMHFYHEALQIARQIKSNEQCCVLLVNIGSWYVDTDEFLQAEPYLREALQIARQIGHREWTCAALLTLTTVLREKGQYAEAKACLQEAFALAKELEIPRFICLALEAEGNLALALCQGDAALLAFQEMRCLSPQEDFEVEALSLYGMARSYEQMGQCDQALSLGKSALTLVQQKSMSWYEHRIQAWYTRFLQLSTPTESITCICGKTFMRPSGPGRTRQYCSDRCASRARKRTQRKRQGKKGQP